MSFRNRCVVLGGSGPIMLSIPLKGGRSQRRLTREVEIDHQQAWAKRHWKTLVSCYNRSPWFEAYRSELEMLYLRRDRFLVDWNQACMEWLTDKLSIQATICLGEGPLDKGWMEAQTEEVADWRNRLMPATIDRQINPAIRYTQVFADRFGFIPNLSLLDFLFCTGGRLIA